MEWLRRVVGGQGGVAAAQGRDAVGGGPAGGGGGAAEALGDLGVRQAGDVVQGDGLALLVRQGPPAGPEPAVGAVVGRMAGWAVRAARRIGRGRRASARSASIALRWAIVTSQACTLASAGRSG